MEKVHGRDDQKDLCNGVDVKSCFLQVPHHPCSGKRHQVKQG